MKIGIMQPYFFPYIGYFQLIDSVDVYVNLEHVNFMKRSYMVRNTLKNNTQINIPVSNGSQNKICTQVFVLSNDSWFNKFEKTIECLYKKEQNYSSIFEQILLPWKNQVLSYENNLDISKFNIFSIKIICEYLNLSTKFETSLGLTGKKKSEGLKDIVKHFEASDYVNAIGGQNLYSKEDFLEQNIKLHFIKMGNLSLENPYNSILDILFRYPKEEIKNELKNYTLI